MSAANLYWDGNPATGSVNATSSGGSGEWNLTDAVWDSGTSRVAWTSNNAAVFGGAGGTVTVGTDLVAQSVQFTGTGYTLTSADAKSLNLSSISSGVNSAIYAGGSGPTNVGGVIYLQGGAANAVTYITAASGSTLNLSGGIAQQNATNNGTEVSGAGAVNYSGTGTFSTGKFNVTGGATFTSSANMSGFTQTYTGIKGTASAPSTWNIAGGTINGGGTALFVGDGSGTSGVLNVTGGTATFTGNLNVGNSFNNVGTNNGDSAGTVTVGGTAVLTVGVIRLGNIKGGQATLNLNGGTLTLSGIILGSSNGGTGTGGFGVVNFNGGILRASAASSSLVDSSLTTANVRNGGAIIDSNSFNLTLTKPLVHSTIAGDALIDGGLIKRGAGVLTLTQTNTYTGMTAIEAGSIYYGAGGTLGTGPVQISGGALLATNTTANVTINNAIGGAGGFSKLTSGLTTLGGTNTFTGAITLINPSSPAVTAVGVLRLTSGQALGPASTSKIINLINSTDASTGGVELTNDITVVNKVIHFGGRTVAAANAALANISGDNAWNGGLEIRNTGGGYPIRSDAGTLTLGGPISNEVVNSTRGFTLLGAGDYSITGLVRNSTAPSGGVTSLVISGTGKTTVSSANTYTGGTAVTAGLLVADSATSSLGSGLTIVSGTGVLTGTGGTGGAVAFGSVSSTGAPVSASPATTGGTVTAGTGGGAGDTPGTLTSGAQTWGSGGTYRVKFANSAGSSGATNGYDRLVMSTLNLSGLSAGKFNLVLLNSTANATPGFATGASGTFTIARVTGTNGLTLPSGFTGTDLTSLFALDSSNLGLNNPTPFSVTYAASTGGGFDIQIAYAAAPEPTTAALVGLGGVALLGRRRRRGSSVDQSMLSDLRCRPVSA